jgi:mono/diheme cytochrome c family protein
VRNQVPEHAYNLMGRVIKAYMIKPSGPSGIPPVAVPEDSTAAYGKHMVMAVANCYECHTKRDAVGAFVGEPLAGGTVFEEPGKPTLISPNLTPDPSGRIFDWTEDMFIRRFRMGKLIEHSHMPWESYRRMSDIELKAIYNYLQTVKPVKTN